jgi:hypothetical protein
VRLANVLPLIGFGNIAERVENYLRRAVNLYLWGFESEVVVMCGATLQAAYRERFTNSMMSQLGYVSDGDSFEARKYEEAALHQKVFTKEQRSLAARLRRARNAVVHTSPEVDMTAGEALPATAGLLACLFLDAN